MTPGPNLFVVGAAKAGTTALWRHLDAHPDVFMSKVKEPHHFSRAGLRPGQGAVKDPAAYVRLFAEGAARRYRGEASPSYLWDPDTPSKIARAAPDARIVVSLRDPVERAWSGYVMLVTIGCEPRTFPEAVEEELAGRVAVDARPPPYLARGRYAEQLERYLDVFGDALALIWFEEFTRDVRGTMVHLYDWLELDPGVALQLPSAPIVPHLEPRNGLARAILAVPGARRAGAAALSGRALRGAQRVFFHHVKPELDSAMRERLREVFADDDARLRSLVGRELPWDAAK